MQPSGGVDRVDGGGPEELIRLVREAENDDGAGQRAPRYKRHDDATVALCLFDRELP